MTRFRRSWRTSKAGIILFHSTWMHHLASLERHSGQGDRQGVEIFGEKMVLVGTRAELGRRGLPQNIVDYSMRRRTRTLLIPKAHQFRLLTAPTFERQLAHAIADRLGIELHLPPFKVFCNDDGCMARVGEFAARCYGFRHGHLPSPASVFLAKAISHNCSPDADRTSDVHQIPQLHRLNDVPAYSP